MSFRTYTIGRSNNADIRLDHGSVSRRHAELTITADGRLFVTDRDSRLGTWVQRDGRWGRHRQGYVDGSEPVRFGEREVTLSNLVRNEELPLKENPGYEPLSIRPHRNPETGEIEL